MKQKINFVKSIFWLIVIAIFVVWVLMVRQENKRQIAQYKQQHEQYEKEHSADVSKCINRGIEQYKLFGSYPTLTTGQSARLVAIDACAKDATVYGVDDIK